MTRYNNVENCHLALATGDDAGGGSGLTAWRNADAEFIAGELIPSDLLLGWNNKLPNYVTTKGGARTSSRIADRHSTGRQEGLWKSKHAFQTSQFLFWLMQTTGTPTTENTPAGYNTHALTIGATNVPKWHGLNFEREGITSNELRYAMMGALPSDLVISCVEGSGAPEDRLATQEISIPYAFLKDGVTEIAPQTVRPADATGSTWKTWDHLIAGNGCGRDPSGLKYNGVNLEVDVLSKHLHFHRDYAFGPRDDTGHPVNGNLLGWDYYITMDVQPIGDLLYDVNKLKPEAYAGDLDDVFSFTSDATNDKISFTYDKMYLVPFDEENDYKKNIEGYTITLEPLDVTSSLTVVGIDNLNNNAYENP